MPPKPSFTEPQIRILRDTAKRVQKRFKRQEDFALALGITQPSGFWGDADLPPPAWPERLDTLEKALEKVRKT